MILPLLLLLLTFRGTCYGQLSVPASPCPDVFRYQSDGQQYYGVITAKEPPVYGSVMDIKVVMSLPAELPSQYVGKVDLYHDSNTVVGQMQRGDDITYALYFPLLQPLPRITSIVFDNRQICSGPPATGNFINTITVSHKFRSCVSNCHLIPQQRPRPRPQMPTSMPVFIDNDRYRPSQGFNDFINLLNGDNRQRPPVYQMETTTTQRPVVTTTRPPPPPPRPRPQPQPQTTPAAVDRFEFVACGMPNAQSFGLIAGGQTALRSDWPWLVALFRKKRTGPGQIKKEFKCGASVVSEKLVLSAAHCVTTSTGKAIRLQELSVLIGAYDIEDETDEFSMNKAVKEIKVREDYNPTTFANDLAVIVLVTPIKFTDYIKPVCLWEGDTDQNLIYDKKAKVVGWGRDEDGREVLAEPKVVEVPLVSTLVCKASNPTLSRLTSENTLCGGAKDGTGPCNGDSGGGLYLRQNGRWYIRGVVSNSLKKEQENVCNLNEYVIYTDAAKYASWVNSIF